MDKSQSIDKKIAIAVIGLLGDSVTGFLNILKQQGFANVSHFESTGDILEFLKIQNFNLLFVFSEIMDVHWTNFLRRIRTDESIPYLPIVLVLGKEEKITESWKSLLKSYQIRDVLGYPPYQVPKIMAAIAQNQADDKNSHSMQTRLKLAAKLYKEGLILQAKKMYQDILDLETSNLVAHAGVMYTQRDDLHEFKKRIDAVLKLDPENFCYKFELLGHFLRANDQKKFNELITDLMGSLRVNREVFWLGELGEICLQLGFNDYSEKIARHILKNRASKEDWRQYILLARVYLIRGHTEEAKIFAERAKNSCAQDRADIYNFQGVISRRGGNHETALKQFEKAIKLSPIDHRIYYNLAVCYKDMGQIDKAIAKLDKAIALNSGYEKASKLRSKLRSLLTHVGS